MVTEGVVEATNNLITDNIELTEINLSGLDNIYAPIISESPNCLYYAKAQSDALNVIKTSIKSNLIEIDGEVATCNKLNLIDGKPLSCCSEVNVNEVNYTRTFETTDWQALYLPYAMSSSDWAQFGEVSQLTDVTEEDGAIVLEWTKVNELTLLPNYPYIFKPKQIGEVTFVSEDTKLYSTVEGGNMEKYLTPSGHTLVLAGNYRTKTDMATSGAYALSGNSFKLAESDAVTLRPLRIYITETAQTMNQARVLKMRVKDNPSATAIDLISVEDLNSSTYYDIQGRKVSNPLFGIFIKDNKKVIIK